MDGPSSSLLTSAHEFWGRWWYLGADDSLFGGLRIPDSIGRGVDIIIIIVSLHAIMAEIFGNRFFSVLSHTWGLLSAISRSFGFHSFFWGSRIHFCKALDVRIFVVPSFLTFFRSSFAIDVICVCGFSTKKPWCRRFIDCVKQRPSLCSETALMPRFPTSCRTGSLGESPFRHGYRKSVCLWENVSV